MLPFTIINISRNIRRLMVTCWLPIYFKSTAFWNLSFYYANLVIESFIWLVITLFTSITLTL